MTQLKNDISTFEHSLSGCEATLDAPPQPAAKAVRRSRRRNYTLTPEQRCRFAHKGFLLLAGAMPQPLLRQWRHLADTLEGEALQGHSNGEQSPDYCVVEDPVGPRLMRFDNLLQRAPDLVLDTLACPAMMAVARELCGPGAVPLHMDLLYKHPHPHPVINWHQGAQHDRRLPYLNIGLYLDDADEGDGCLRYVPGTQHGPEPIDMLSERFGWHPPGVVEQPAQAGDILIQDMMILHGSQPKRSSGVRRTIYVEFRPWQAVVQSGAQSADWARLRREWMSLVLACADRRDLPEDAVDYPSRPQKLSSLVRAIEQSWEPPLPAVWASRDVDHPDYPVPGDLRGDGESAP